MYYTELIANFIFKTAQKGTGGGEKICSTFLKF